MCRTNSGSVWPQLTNPGPRQLPGSGAGEERVRSQEYADDPQDEVAVCGVRCAHGGTVQAGLRRLDAGAFAAGLGAWKQWGGLARRRRTTRRASPSPGSDAVLNVQDEPGDASRSGATGHAEDEALGDGLPVALPPRRHAAPLQHVRPVSRSPVHAGRQMRTSALNERPRDAAYCHASAARRCAARSTSSRQSSCPPVSLRQLETSAIGSEVAAGRPLQPPRGPGNHSARLLSGSLSG